MRSLPFDKRERTGPAGTWRLAAALTALGLAVLPTLALPEPDRARSAPAADCDRYASPTGNDRAPGSQSRPYRTARKLVASLGRGETGCFRTGTYGFRKLEVKRRRITLAPFRDEAVTLRGDIKVLPRGKGSIIEDMTLDGSGGKNQIGPRINASGVVLRRNDITNRHTGICVLVGRFYSRPAPRAVVIKRNRIHDCGKLPATNHHHGIYLAESRRATIRDNWIYDNADRGIQLYPDAQRSVIVGNVIDGNGQGVIFAGSGGRASNNNVVRGNVIANSKTRWNVASGPEGPRATGNGVRRNCVWASNRDSFYNSRGGVQTPSRNFSARRNKVARPRYVDRGTRDFRLRGGSRCTRRLAATAPPK